MVAGLASLPTFSHRHHPSEFSSTAPTGSHSVAGSKEQGLFCSHTLRSRIEGVSYLPYPCHPMAYEGMGRAALLLSLPQAWLLSAPAYRVSSNVLPRQGALLCAGAGLGAGPHLMFSNRNPCSGRNRKCACFVQF